MMVFHGPSIQKWWILSYKTDEFADSDPDSCIPAVKDGGAFT